MEMDQGASNGYKGTYFVGYCVRRKVEKEEVQHLAMEMDQCAPLIRGHLLDCVAKDGQ
jgi:hypothetical protein